MGEGAGNHIQMSRDASIHNDSVLNSPVSDFSIGLSSPHNSARKYSVHLVGSVFSSACKIDVHDGQ